MDRELELRGAGMDQTTVTGSGTGSLVTALQGGVLSDLTLRDNTSDVPGGGLHVKGFGQYSFEVTHVRIEGCSGAGGGGFYRDSGAAPHFAGLSDALEFTVIP